jgi:hypothetical protein
MCITESGIPDIEVRLGTIFKEKHFPDSVIKHSGEECSIDKAATQRQ